VAITVETSHPEKLRVIIAGAGVAALMGRPAAIRWSPEPRTSIPTTTIGQ
jgi:hypothetical protein